MVAVLLPLVTWPAFAAPFSTPKLWLLAGAVALLLPLAAWRAGRLGTARHTRRALSGSKLGGVDASTDAGVPPVPPMLQAMIVAWLASFAWSALAAPTVSPDALLLGVAGPLWCLLIVLTGVSFARLTAAHVAGATAMACIALGQAIGRDPFVGLGWRPGIEGASTRMRVYGTLGNPNFVAALIAITIPLACGLAASSSVSRRTRVLTAFAIAVLVAALALTGSRAGAIGLACGVVVVGMFLRHRLSRWVMAGAVIAALATIVASDARGAVETLCGRVYVWQTAWAHAWERPVAGVGPGAFELHYIGWDEAARASARRTGARDLQFAGPQQFAHNDYLQALVERGVAGIVTTVFVLATPVLLWRGSRRAAPEARAVLAGAAGAVAAFAAVACLDFPFERPAETAALWMAVALAWQSTRRAFPNTTHTGEVST